MGMGRRPEDWQGISPRLMTWLVGLVAVLLVLTAGGFSYLLVKSAQSGSADRRQIAELARQNEPDCEAKADRQTRQSRGG